MQVCLYVCLYVGMCVCIYVNIDACKYGGIYAMLLLLLLCQCPVKKLKM